MSVPLLDVRNLSKSFGANPALRDVSFELNKGEVHALIGENGAGKSTLMKVLSGAIRPDGGAITLDGQPYLPRDPKDAKDRGVAMIYQELTLALHLTVEANVMLGQERSRLGLLNNKENARLVRNALALLDHPEIRPDRIVGTLSVGAKQLVEVARALVSDSRVVIFDEPTSSLTRHDAATLFSVIRRLRDQGLSIIYISHFLEEVRAIADRYTVLRDGANVAGGAIEGVEASALIRQMVGRDIGEIYPRVPREIGDPILQVSALKGDQQFPVRVDLTLRRGEILGIAGLVGSGRTELLRAIYGLDKVRSGEVVVKGLPTPSVSPSQRISQGFGLLSEDRKAEGLAQVRSIEDNITYPALQIAGRFGWLNLRSRRRDVERLIRQVNVRCQGPSQAVADLSGGNQQKVALARLLYQRADILLLDEPTKGIDVGSKAEIYRLIGELAARGVCVLMVSSYLPELFGVCDRLAVMSRGLLSAPREIQDWTDHSVMEAATA